MLEPFLYEPRTGVPPRARERFTFESRVTGETPFLYLTRAALAMTALETFQLRGRDTVECGRGNWARP